MSGVPFSLIVSPRNQTIAQNVVDAVVKSGGIIFKFDAARNLVTEAYNPATRVFESLH